MSIDDHRRGNPRGQEDCGAAIAAGEDVIERAGAVEAWLEDHAAERSDWRCNKSMRMLDPNSLSPFLASGSKY